jgi:hypothetical protein
LSRIEEHRWRQAELTFNADIESDLHAHTGRPRDSERSLLMEDNPDPEFFAKLGGKVKSFVRVRHMRSKNGKSFKEPTHVGKHAVLQVAIAKVTSGRLIEQLPPKENSWIFQAFNSTKLPVLLVLPTDGNVDPSSEQQLPLPHPSTEQSNTIDDVDSSDSLQIKEIAFFDWDEICRLRVCLKGNCVYLDQDKTDVMKRPVKNLIQLIQPWLQQITTSNIALSLPHCEIISTPLHK